jgi:O-antigen/teichoic acid export membrane protein
VSPLLPGIVLSGGLYAAGQIAAQMLLTSFRTRQLLAPKVGTALLGIALNFAGAMLWGVRGLVAAGIAFGVVYLAWILYLARDLDGAVPAAS